MCVWWHNCAHVCTFAMCNKPLHKSVYMCMYMCLSFAKANTQYTHRTSASCAVTGCWTFGAQYSREKGTCTTNAREIKFKKLQFHYWSFLSTMCRIPWEQTYWQSCTHAPSVCALASWVKPWQWPCTHTPLSSPSPWPVCALSWSVHHITETHEDFHFDDCQYIRIRPCLLHL